MEITETASRRKPPRGARWPEESVPRVDYAQAIRARGPRQGESVLAFEKRMAMIVGIRGFWLDVWRRVGGNRIDAAALAGIPPNNMAFELRTVGLSYELLNDALLGKVQLG